MHINLNENDIILLEKYASLRFKNDYNCFISFLLRKYDKEIKDRKKAGSVKSEKKSLSSAKNGKLYGGRKNLRG